MEEIYDSVLKGTSGQLPNPRRVALLEVSQYLEKYLWPNFSAEDASPEHLLSMIVLANRKLNERTNPWPYLQQDQVLSRHEDGHRKRV